MHASCGSKESPAAVLAWSEGAWQNAFRSAPSTVPKCRKRASTQCQKLSLQDMSAHRASTGGRTHWVKVKPYRTWLPTRYVRCRMRFWLVWYR